MTDNYTSEGLRYGLQVVYENQFQLKCVQKKVDWAKYHN